MRNARRINLPGMSGQTLQLGSLDAAPTSATARDCAALLVLACALRFFWLDHQPLWTDELFSVYWSQLDAGFLLGEGARLETNPPAYFLLLHGWIAAFGTGAFAMRLPSALFSAATVPVVYAIGRILLDRPTALLAGLFIALSPVAVFCAQEARAYALLVLCDSLAMLALAGYARRLATAGTRSWPWLSVFVLAAIAGVLLHYTSLLFIGACFGAIALRLLTMRPFPIREALVWIGAGLVIAAAIAGPLLVAMSLSSSVNIAWIRPPNALTILGFCLGLLLYPTTIITLGTLAPVAGLLLVVAAALPRLKLDRLQFGVLVLIPLLFILALIGVSVWRSVLTAQVGMWVTTPLTLILARAAMVQPLPRARAVVVGAVTLYFLIGLGSYYAYSNIEDWPAGVRLVMTEPRCGGPILMAAGKGFGLTYYGPPPPGRPAYAFAVNDRGQQTALFVLNRRVMHPGILDAEAVENFVRARPGTVVLIAPVDLLMAPASLRSSLENAPFQAVLSRGLDAFCF
jgi:4-amino-4-deoxy-L-arabinose transferase-like glycosyltransferase